MRRIAMILGAATVMTAACTHLDDARGQQQAGGRSGEVPIYTLPSVRVAGDRKLDMTFKELHTFALCSQERCDLNVYIGGDCSNPDVDPQGIALDHRIDQFTLTYHLHAPKGANLVLLDIMEKGHGHHDPHDIFQNQAGEGTTDLSATVKNHFPRNRQYVIVIGKPGRPCAVLDPPIMPDY